MTDSFSLNPFQSYMLEHVKQMPAMRGTDVLRDKLKTDYGLDVGFIHLPSLVHDNAMFIPRGTKGEVLDTLKRAGIDKKVITDVKQAFGRHGLIVTGKRLKRRGVVEHEAGHAIAAGAGGPIEKAVHAPWMTRWVGPTLGMGGAFGALMLGRHLPPLAGIPAGIGAGLLAGSPTLYAEYRANQRAKELLTAEQAEKMPFKSQLGGYAWGLGTGLGLLPASVGALMRATQKLRGK